MAELTTMLSVTSEERSTAEGYTISQWQMDKLQITDSEEMH